MSGPPRHTRQADAVPLLIGQEQQSRDGPEEPVPRQHLSLLALEPVDSVAVGGHDQEVQLALFVFSERQDRQVVPFDRFVRGRLLRSWVVGQGPDLAADVVGVDVLARQSRDR